MTCAVQPGGQGAYRRRLSPVIGQARHVLRELLRQAPDGCALLVACSGGPDSLALAAVAAWVGAKQARPVASVTVDHGIRPEAAAEAAGAARVCADLGCSPAFVAQVAGGGDTNLRRSYGSKGPEGDARHARYQCLQTTAEQWGQELGMPVLVLLGHTLDDQAETVLLGLGRGSGARSLAGMEVLAARHAAVAGAEFRSEFRAEGGVKSGAEGGAAKPPVWWGRPFLGLRRADTVEICAVLGLDPVDDPSNYVAGPWRRQDGGPLRRAAVRETVLPALAAALGQDVAPALARTASQLRRDDDALQILAGALLAEALLPVTELPGVEPDSLGGPVRLCLSVPVLAAAHAAIRSRAIMQAGVDLGWDAGSVQYGHVAAIEALINDWRGQGPVFLPGGLQAHRRRACLYFY